MQGSGDLSEIGTSVHIRSIERIDLSARVRIADVVTYVIGDVGILVYPLAAPPMLLKGPRFLAPSIMYS